MRSKHTINDALEQGQIYLKGSGVSSSRLDTELILAHCIEKDRAKLYADSGDNLNHEDYLLFLDLIERRAQREPLAYILGHKEFWTVDLCVNGNVLIPRPETELLVKKSAELLHHCSKPGIKQKVLDFGTGCGAVAIALAKETPSVMLYATDVSFDALKIAKANVERFNLNERIVFICEQSLSAFRYETSFDFVVSNPPYISTQDIELLEPEIKNYEPRHAIDGGDDGLKYYKLIIPLGLCILNDHGWLVLEIGAGQSRAVMELFRSCIRYDNTCIFQDDSGHKRVIIAQKR